MRARNNEFIGEHLRSDRVRSRGKKQRQNYGKHCLGFPFTGRMTINENSGVRRYRERNECAGRQ